ncbi:MAG: tandem-95 repeat protein, partial [Gemmataceae bacterium]|nr:tandem-95 repeat protein [Gemmataceae bacterium]
VQTNGTTITYTPDPNYHGTDRFTYTIDDDHGGVATATVFVTITPVNDPPVAQDDVFTTIQGRPVGIDPLTVLANDTDIDGGQLRFVALIGGAVHGTVTRNAQGGFTYTPERGFSGRDQIEYEIDDSRGGTDRGTIFIDVQPTTAGSFGPAGRVGSTTPSVPGTVGKATVPTLVKTPAPLILATNGPAASLGNGAAKPLPNQDGAGGGAGQQVPDRGGAVGGTSTGKDSSLRTVDADRAPTFQQPALHTITVSTTVSVPDGGTVLMGGLKRLSEGRNEFGPPILSKIPYVNRLFENVGYGREAESLMLMVTPRIIISEEEEAL